MPQAGKLSHLFCRTFSNFCQKSKSPVEQICFPSSLRTQNGIQRGNQSQAYCIFKAISNCSRITKRHVSRFVLEIISSVACVMLNRDPINHWWWISSTYSISGCKNQQMSALLEDEHTLQCCHAHRRHFVLLSIFPHSRQSDWIGDTHSKCGLSQISGFHERRQV